MNKNILFYGKSFSGKTTAIIGNLKLCLEQCPNLKIGVWERYPEIKSQISEVIKVDNPYPALVEAFDLFVVAGGIGIVEEREIITGAIHRNVPVWYEVCASREKLEGLYKVIPCLKEFEKVECRI